MSLTDIFLTLVDMSVDAAWVALAVMILRLVLKKAPKWMHCCLWLLVAVRLICPFTVESVFSLVSMDGAKETVDKMLDGYVGPSSTYWDHTEEYKTAVSVGIEPIYAGEGHYYVVTGETPTTEIPIVADYIAPVWVAGMGIMLFYAAISYFQLRRKVGASLISEKGIYLCDYIDTPFILGILKPRIYMPSSMEPDAAVHVIAHERSHLNRKDHLWKPLGYLLLTVHWFNPVMWLAYILLCRDIELACDEKVIRKMGTVDKKAYSEALLSCSVPRYIIAACPLAFGEVGVKERVKSVLNYKKPTFWIILIAVIALIAAAVCLLTDPASEDEFTMSGSNVSDIDTQQVLKQIRKYNSLEDRENIYMNSRGFSILLDENFDFASVSIQYFFYKEQKTYSSILIFAPYADSFMLLGTEEWEEQDSIFLLEHYLEALRNLPQEEIRAMTPGERYSIRQVEEGTPADYDRVIRYSEYGVGTTDGWYIHLEVTPMYQQEGKYNEAKEEAIHLFYGDYRQVQEGSDIVIPYVLAEDGTLIPVLETSEGQLYVKANLVSYYDGQNRPGRYCLGEGELGYLMNILEDIPESAWEDGLHVENYGEFHSELFLGLGEDPEEEAYGLEATLFYTDGGVNLRFYKDGRFLEKTYHIRYDPLTEFIESLCDNSRREGNIHIMYPDTVVEYTHDDITVALQPMVGWEYEIVHYTDDATPFGIRCRPEWEEEGWLFVSYWPDGFASCGTGLETMERQWGWGDCIYDTISGYYDGSENWSFISFTGTPYVILNEGADPWFERADDIVFMVCGSSHEGLLPLNTELVQYSYGYVNMSLRLPQSWEYEIDEWTETYENGLNLQTCGIRFRPEGEEGWIALRFRSNIFGAFNQEDMEKYSGMSVEWTNYEVTLGGPQYGNVWQYIRYNFYRDGRTYIPGTYIAWNEGADKWMRETENYLWLMDILGRVRLGEGVLRSDQALEIACNAVDLPEEYGYGMEHDYLTGIYTVVFSSKEGQLYDVQIDNNGTILSVSSGL